MTEKSSSESSGSAATAWLKKLPKKILLIRLDKIGDLVCTLCVDQIPAMQANESHWVIAKGLAFIPEHAWPLRNFREFAKIPETYDAFLQYVRELKPDIAVSFQAPWWINMALWKAGVPVRVGVRSQWHSYLFLNKGLRQKRSEAIKHEADYNRELLEYAIDAEAKPATGDSTVSSSYPTPILKLKARENPELLARENLRAQDYIVVHPGMAGSALNWPVENYVRYVERIAQDHQVVLTGTPADEIWLKDLKNHFDKHPRVLCLQNKLSPAELLTILEKALAVVAPSTGVAHLAASLGAPVMGLYSAIKVQHPRRWAARGDQVQIFMLDETSPEQLPPFQRNP